MINYNNPIHKYYQQIISGIKHVPIVVECGACDFADTRDMAELLHNAYSEYRYYAFEIDHRFDKSAEDLKSKTPLKVNVIWKAVGNVDGIVEMNVSHGTPEIPYYGSSSIKTPKIHAKEWPNMRFEKGQVECCKLDTFCHKNDIEYIDLLYVDIEGAELDLIRGAKSILAKTHYFHTEFLGQAFEEDNVSLENIMNLLGDRWEIIENFGTDVLLVNKGAL